MEACREGKDFLKVFPCWGQKLAPLCPLAFLPSLVLPAKAVPLNMALPESLQESSQTHGWALNLRSEKVVPASFTRCHRGGEVRFLILDAHRAGGAGVGGGSVDSCLTWF